MGRDYWVKLTKKEFMSTMLVAVLATCLLLAPTEGQAARWSFYDIDGTLVMDRVHVTSKGKIMKPAWSTFWEFQKVAPSLSGQERFEELDAAGLLPAKVYLSRYERDLLLDRFADNDRRTGKVEAYELENDPVLEAVTRAYKRYGFNRTDSQIIYPGYYSATKNGEETFKFHREEGFTKAPILIDAELAWMRHQTDKMLYRYEGKAFKYLVYDLVNFRGGDRIHIITDRVVSAATGFRLLKYWQSIGLIPEDVPNSTLRAVEFLSMNDYVTRTAFDRKKPEVIKSKLYELANSSPTDVPKHSVLSDRLGDAREGVTFQGHEVIVYENDPSYIDSMFRDAGGELGFYHDIKFMLYHAGSNQEVANSLINRGIVEAEQHQRFVVLQPEMAAGSFRAIIDQERGLLRARKCGEVLDKNEATRHRED